MLVLTRNTGQTIMVGEQIQLTVLSVRGRQVRLGVTAPKDVDVHRKEIYLKIKSQQQNEASEASSEVNHCEEVSDEN